MKQELTKISKRLGSDYSLKDAAKEVKDLAGQLKTEIQNMPKGQSLSEFFKGKLD